jgi:hypothetical protein
MDPMFDVGSSGLTKRPQQLVEAINFNETSQYARTALESIIYVMLPHDECVTLV